jgi:hypothetical protein
MEKLKSGEKNMKGGEKNMKKWRKKHETGLAERKKMSLL